MKRFSINRIHNPQLAELAAGPLVFLAVAALAGASCERSAAIALGTAAWMACWWIFRPVHIAVTSFLPIVMNAFFCMVPAEKVIAQYFSDIVILLLGSDLICLTWSTTGLDRRVSVRALGCIGPSMKQQIFAWLLASVVLSIFLPNVVVAAIFCPIASAMLRASGETGLRGRQLSIPILLAIGWGSGIGGFGSPIGSAANLVAISYLEQLTGREFMYIDWVIRFLPLLAVITLVNLLFLLHLPLPTKTLHGTKGYFQKLYQEFGPMSRGEWISLLLFSAATLLSFARPLFASLLPGMKPAYIFLLCGLLLFILKDEKGQTMLSWPYAESHCMWGMMFLFASGMALGQLLIGTGAVDHLAGALTQAPLTGGLLTMVLFCAFAALFSEISSNTAAASVALPITISLCSALSLNPVPYVIASIVAANCAYILPISTRAIPVGYGLPASVQIRRGIQLALLSLGAAAAACYAASLLFPIYSHL